MCDLIDLPAPLSDRQETQVQDMDIDSKGKLTGLAYVAAKLGGAESPAVQEMQYAQFGEVWTAVSAWLVDIVTRAQILSRPTHYTLVDSPGQIS